MLIYEFPLYITIDSHWICLDIILRDLIGHSESGGGKICIFGTFLIIFCTGGHHKYKNRSQHILAYHFQLYMTIYSHCRCFCTILRHQIGYRRQILRFFDQNRPFSQKWPRKVLKTRFLEKNFFPVLVIVRRIQQKMPAKIWDFCLL